MRVRIAPSPTGYFNIATARTALYNWLLARQAGGTFILRIEDTDRERSTAEFDNDIREALAWLGLSYDELYRQTERTEIYRKYLQKLLDENKAFYCPHTKEELAQESDRQKEKKEPLRHICSARDGSADSGIIRFKNEAHNDIHIEDAIRGNISFHAPLLGDFSLAKSLDEVLYNFAVIVDDYEMHITHVIRGEDHISNTPKQILVLEALGFPKPTWAHLPLLLGTDRSKLSKRHGGFSIKEYRDRGYLPEAMINFVALLGWHPSAAENIGKKEQELFSLDEIIKLFSLDRIQKGGAIADYEKLNWFNREYIKLLSTEEFLKRSEPFISQSTRTLFPDQRWEIALHALQARVTTLADIEQEMQAILHPAAYTKDLLLWRGKIPEMDVKRLIDEILNIFSNIIQFDKNSIEHALAPLTEKEGKGRVLWPLRAALSGREASLGPFELAEILGKNTCIERLTIAKNLL